MKLNHRKFKIRYVAEFFSTNKKGIIKIWFAEPQNSNYQKINKFFISPKPINSYEDTQGNKILYFEFKNMEKIKIEANMEITLFKGKIDPTDKNCLSFQATKRLFQQYTKSEKFLEKTPEIKKVVKKLTKNDKTDLEKIKSIFNFVIKNFKYCYPVKRRGVKKLNLKNPEGDCGEYSSLFVVMCRILKIPARNQTGFVIFPKNNKVREHGWASVYLKPKGWVDIDSQYASIEKDFDMGTKKYFLKRSEYRLTFINGFNIPLKPKISKGFNVDYWRKIKLPSTESFVQILQPIFFASKGKIKFREEIKLL